ncbi:MAG: hypothetical protein J2P48_21645 [Alphaproteobacteria bacterium]|nr:hypothetical protein [Alphaproteobacteria bacterium]
MASQPWVQSCNPGRRRLAGTYPVSGAKNAVLPLMISALLTPHLATLHNLPANLDVAVLPNLLQRLGVGLSWSIGCAGLSVTLCSDQVYPTRVYDELVGRMRASILLLGALLARCGEASMPIPVEMRSGCAASASTLRACVQWVLRWTWLGA